MPNKKDRRLIDILDDKKRMRDLLAMETDPLKRDDLNERLGLLEKEHVEYRRNLDEKYQKLPSRAHVPVSPPKPEKAPISEPMHSTPEPNTKRQPEQTKASIKVIKKGEESEWLYDSTPLHKKEPEQPLKPKPPQPKINPILGPTPMIPANKNTTEELTKNLSTLSKAVGGSSSSVGGKAGEGDSIAFNPLEAVVSGMQAGNAIFQTAAIVLHIFVRATILPAELILRRRFGERYFSPLVVFVSILLYVIPNSASGLDWKIPAAFGAIIGIGTMLSQRACYRRDRRGEYWHSYSEGEPRLRIASIDQYYADRYFTFDFSVLILEPLVIVLFGILGYWLIPYRMEVPFGGYDTIEINPVSSQIITIGVFDFLYQLYCFLYRRQKLLDEKDQRVLMEARTNTVERPQSGLSYHKGVAFIPKSSKAVKWDE